MKKRLLFAAATLFSIHAFSQGVYQIPNSDFETEWTNKNEPGNGWNSFTTATGALNMFSGTSAPTTTQTEGRNGSKSAVLLKSIWVFIANANGNLTTGVINMGSATPSDVANFNFTKRDDEKHSCLFAGRPDSVVFYAKYKPSAKDVKGQGNFILHGNTNYQDPYESSEREAIYKVAQARLDIPATEGWTRFSRAFTYYKQAPSDSVRYMLASFTTNSKPGATKGDELTLDDVSLVYNSSIDSIKISGKPLDGFDKGKYNYEVDMPYVDNIVAYSLDGIGATTVASYDEMTGVCTIEVRGDDYSVNPKNVHVYKLQFQKAEVETFTDDLIVTINNQSAPAQSQSIKKACVAGEATCTLSIDNFSMVLGENSALVGDIVLPNVAMTSGDNDTIVYSSSQTIRITSSDPSALGAMLGDVPVVLTAKSKGNKMVAYIEIDMTNTMLQQLIKVTFGVNPSGVVGVETDNDKASSIYNMGGVKIDGGKSLNALPKGVYIVNGKKVSL